MKSLLQEFAVRRLLVALCFGVAVAGACAADPATVGVRNSVPSNSSPTAAETERTARAALQAEMAQIWGLSSEEMARAAVLLRGPRAAFSSPSLTPLEALGIHARSAAERRKYAEAFVNAYHQDVERVVAWNQAATEALARLYPNETAVSFDGLPPVAAEPSAAAAANVPLTAIKPLPRKAPR
jgi:hypothetical protein